MEKYDRKIILEDGAEYYGYGFGDTSDKVCEIVFNTSMVGYQEIVSDPSYTYQAVVMTYPLIGNYGICDDDYETNTPTIGALIVREYNNEPSNFRSVATLDEIMKKYRIPGVWGVDTRKLTRSIRDHGSRKALITDADTPIRYPRQSCLIILRSEPTTVSTQLQSFCAADVMRVELRRQLPLICSLSANSRTLLTRSKTSK